MGHPVHFSENAARLSRSEDRVWYRRIEVEQQNLSPGFGISRRESRFLGYLFCASFSPIPRYYSPPRYLDEDQPRRCQHILNRNQARRVADNSPLQIYGSQRENKAATMRLTVDKKQFARIIFGTKEKLGYAVYIDCLNLLIINYKCNFLLLFASNEKFWRINCGKILHILIIRLISYNFID